MNSCRHKVPFTLTVAIAVQSVGGAGADVGYRVTELEWNCYVTCHYPKAINSAGQICGIYNLPGAPPDYAFFADPATGEFVDLGTVAGCAHNNVDAIALNDNGAVAGTVSAACPRQAWIWTEATGMVGLGDLPGGIESSEARAINNLNQVVGDSWSDEGQFAFLWDAANGMISLGYIPCDDFPNGSIAFDINDAGWVLGETCPGTFIWTPEGGMQLVSAFTGGVFLGGPALNNRGQILGYGTVDGLIREVLWDPQSGNVLIPRAAGYENRQHYVGFLNDLGVVVGAFYPQITGDPEFFVWDAQRGTRLLDDLLAPCWPIPGNPDPRLWVTGINNAGQIVAYPRGDPLVNGVILTPYLRGDVDEDGDVDLPDLVVMLSNFGRASGATYAEGDLDCDADVDLRDLATQLSSFGETYP